MEGLGVQAGRPLPLPGSAALPHEGRGQGTGLVLPWPPGDPHLHLLQPGELQICDRKLELCVEPFMQTINITSAQNRTFSGIVFEC